ncbi:hypothetical protein [Nostoc sp.]|uniref:hypothetical protein n=1 Tax=Nostoc sp. TaxID=1180 RepID=UPI002FFD2AA7
MIDQEDWRLKIADWRFLVQAQQESGRNKFQIREAASLVGTVNRQSTIGNLQLFNL